MVRMHREHHRRGNSLRDVILGGQDGLVNILGIILGVIAGGGSTTVLLATGFAAAITESISMGAVGYTSSIAQRDYYRAEQDRETAEIETMPGEEREEIRKIYAAKGFSGDLLEQVVDTITAHARAGRGAAAAHWCCSGSACTPQSRSWAGGGQRPPDAADRPGGGRDRVPDRPAVRHRLTALVPTEECAPVSCPVGPVASGLGPRAKGHRPRRRWSESACREASCDGEQQRRSDTELGDGIGEDRSQPPDCVTRPLDKLSAHYHAMPGRAVPEAVVKRR